MEKVESRESCGREEMRSVDGVDKIGGEGREPRKLRTGGDENDGGRKQ